MFNFCLFPNWSFGLKECPFHNSILDSWKSGFLFIPEFFFDEKTKKCRSRSENFEKVLNFFRKNHFRIKMSNRIAKLAIPLKVSCWKANELFVKVPKSLRKAFFFNYFLTLRESKLWISHRELFVERQKISRSVIDKVSKCSEISKSFPGCSSVIRTILQQFQTA